MDQAVLDVEQEIKKRITCDEYAIYGHSMGALITYELIKRSETILPKHVFISGLAAPHLRKRRENIYLLSDENFINEIINLNGTPDGFFDNVEFREIFIPILKADFRIISDLCYKAPPKKKISQNISVLYGSDEDIDYESILAWGDYSLGTCDFHEIPGNHFFLNTSYTVVCQTVKDKIQPYL